jgi:hypothetical protein
MLAGVFLKGPLIKTRHSGAMRGLILPLLLAACGASPAPQFFGATRHEVTKGGIDFVVFQKDSYAEVVRLGYLTRAERAPVPQLMAAAAEAATGCRVVPGSMVTGLPGDTGEARFRLTC